MAQTRGTSVVAEEPHRGRISYDLPTILRVKKGAIPKWIAPQLATLVDDVPKGENWVHETKYDGYRILCRIEKRRATFLTRRGLDWSHRFGRISQDVRRLPVDSALFDGEWVAFDARGRTDFQALQNALTGAAKHDLIYVVFDLLHVNGYDLTDAPLVERKQLLRSILRSRASGTVQYSPHTVELGREEFQRACKRGLEGMISKRAGAPYRSGRSRDWLKIKCIRSQEFVIGGYTDPGGSRAGFGALLLGVFDRAGSLHYAGRVGTGFSDQSLRHLLARMRPLEHNRSPFAELDGASPEIHWLKPQLVAEVDFHEWTRDQMVRQASFKGLREDKSAKEVVREHPTAAPRKSRRQPVVQREDADVIAGVRISHPDKVLYPDQGLTKRDLALYYGAIAEHILPHLVDRPLSLLRCPEGYDKECFFQKHAYAGIDPTVRKVRIREKSGTGIYLAVDSPRALVSLAQSGVLELHTWGSRTDLLERPDRMTFDLDPDPAVAWPHVVKLAYALRERITSLGLGAFVKTTGGKGLHVVVPIKRTSDWKEVEQFAGAIANSFVRNDPGLYIATMSKSKRAGKIFIDHFRNRRGATAVAAYSTRARTGAPVSAPIDWNELTPRLKSDHFSVWNIPTRLAKLKRDPWDGYEDARRSLTRAMLNRSDRI